MVAPYHLKGDFIMPKYKVGYSYGFAGDTSYDVVEADDEEEAQEIVWEMAVQRVDAWVEGIVSDDGEEE
jgi:hypothetical protein